MKIKIYQVDAFTSKLFGGNPAAVCPLQEWLSDELLQQIAAENNLAETAFYIPKTKGYHIRWFTPKAEVNLCGHATLAAAFVLFNEEGFSEELISFDSKSGILTVQKSGKKLTLNFPADQIEKISLTDELEACFDIPALEVYRGKNDFMMIYETEEQINSIKPRLNNIAKFDSRGIIVTAKGKEADFVSRYFAPQFGIDEDPVTGSAYTTLMPYWTQKLNKNELKAIQLSERKGHLTCKLMGDRVEISGEAVLYMKGEINV